MSTLLDLTERNANHIIPSYCHRSVSCRRIVDRYGPLGSCKPQIKKKNVYTIHSNCYYNSQPFVPPAITQS